MDKLTQALLSASTHIASKEGIEDEEKVALRAHEIYQDALKEVPDTDAGKEAKQHASDIVAVQKTALVQSPYSEQPKYDMNKHFDESVTPSVKEVFAKIAEYVGPLAGTASKPSEALVEERREIFSKLGVEIQHILNKNNVWTAHFSYLFADMKQIIADLEADLKDQVLGHTQLLVRGAMAVRHPDPTDNTYQAEFATYADLLAARERMIKSTGGKIEDYFRPKA